MKTLLIAGLLSLCVARSSDATSRSNQPASELDVLKEGAVGDGITLSTDAIQHAIDKLSAQGGGTLHFPQGKYLTGTINLRSHIHICLERNAVLLGSLNPQDYPPEGEFFDGRGSKCNRVLVNACGLEDVGISGSGTIDGQGDLMTGMNPRPFLVRFQDCTNVGLEDVTLSRASMWTCHLWGSTNVSINRITITRNPHGANNDGIDIDGSSDVQIRNCSISTGDDAICLKATVDRPCRRISIQGCSLDTLWNGFKIGTESVGDFENISMADCVFTKNVKGGIRIYSVDGSNIRGIILENIRLLDVSMPVYIRLGSRLKSFRKGDHPRMQAGSISGIVMRNIKGTANRAQAAVFITGIPGYPVRDVRIENMDLYVPGGDDGTRLGVPMQERESAYPEPYTIFGPLPAYAFVLRHVEDCSFSNISIHCMKRDFRPAAVCIDTRNVSMDKMRFFNPPDNPPAEIMVVDSRPESVRCEGWDPPQKIITPKKNN